MTSLPGSRPDSPSLRRVFGLPLRGFQRPLTWLAVHRFSVPSLPSEEFTYRSSKYHMRSLSGSNLNRESELSGAVAGRVGTAIGQANRTHQVSWDPRRDHAAGLFVYQPYLSVVQRSAKQRRARWGWRLKIQDNMRGRSEAQRNLRKPLTDAMED